MNINTQTVDDNRYINLSHDWWKFITDEVVFEAGKLLGIDISNVSFSGFSHQGSGSSFKGRYTYAHDSVRKIKNEFRKEYSLHRIAKDLEDIQKSCFFNLEAHITPTHRENNILVEVYHTQDQHRDIGEAEEKISQAMKDFNNWIYSKLKEEYEFLTSDIQVLETLSNIVD